MARMMSVHGGLALGTLSLALTITRSPYVTHGICPSALSQVGKTSNVTIAGKSCREKYVYVDYLQWLSLILTSLGSEVNIFSSY